MNSATDFHSWINRTAIVTMVCALLSGVYLLRLTAKLPSAINVFEQPAHTSYKWPAPSSAHKDNWTIVQSSRQPSSDSSPGQKRFRLAGTFFEYSPTANKERLAILDDLSSGLQHVVRENDTFDNVRIKEIYLNHVILNDGTRDIDLWLTFSEKGGAAGGQAADGTGSGKTAGIKPLGPADAFGGRRIGESRWVYDREGLLNYYQELRNEPERLVQVFDSLKPLYNAAGRINGYKLGVEGEAAFFKSVGLNEGDVVRKVNSLEMTNRQRAEFLISQFVQNRASAFILEIERNGNPKKLVYEIR